MLIHGRCAWVSFCTNSRPSEIFCASRRFGSLKALFRRTVQFESTQNFDRFHVLSRQKFHNNALLNTRVHIFLRHNAAHNKSALTNWTDLLPSTLHPYPTYFKTSRYSLHLGSVKKKSPVNMLSYKHCVLSSRIITALLLLAAEARMKNSKKVTFHVLRSLWRIQEAQSMRTAKVQLPGIERPGATVHPSPLISLG